MKLIRFLFHTFAVLNNERMISDEEPKPKV
jgi:hypothetical protein